MTGRFANAHLAGLLTAGLVAVGSPAAAAEGVAVVASIKPIHSLVASVMAGVGTPGLLVAGSSSPHDYAMKPSDARRLREAAVVFWVGDKLETFLEKPIRTLGKDAVVVELAGAPGVTLLDYRVGGPWEADGHDHGGGHDHGHGKAKHGKAAAHDHDGKDMHLWLDPHNAKAIVRAVAATLSTKDPANKLRYQANADATIARLEKLDSDLTARLQPVAQRPFVVFHDAYQYLEKHFGLAAAGSVTVSPERQPSSRRIAAIRSRIEALGAVCVFSEPQFTPRLIETITRGTKARKGVLDPLGASLPDGPDLYFELMESNAKAIRDCLEPTS